MAFDIKKHVSGMTGRKDMTKPEAGADFTPAPEGLANMRLVGYYEFGQHEEKTGQYKGKINTKVQLVFELSGAKWAPRETEKGKVPFIISMDLNYGLTERSNFFKIFTAMNKAHGEKYTNITDFLGLEFRGVIEHNTKTYGGKDRTFANIKDIRKAEREMEDGTWAPVKVDPPLTPIKGFIWDDACPEMWDDIFIAGQWDERKNDAGEVIKPAQSKNVIQARIMSALNWKACPVHDYAQGKFSAEDLKSMQDALTGDEESSEDAPPPEPTRSPQADQPDPMGGVA